MIDFISTFRNNVYMCKVRETSIRSSLELNTLGTPLDYNITDDRVMQYEDSNVVTYLSIPRMVELFLDGREIRVIESEDIPEIHDVCRRYIMNMIDSGKAYNGPIVDYNYLRDVESFADECLKLNRPSIIKPVLERMDIRGDYRRLNNNPIPVTEEEWGKVEVTRPDIPNM